MLFFFLQDAQCSLCIASWQLLTCDEFQPTQSGLISPSESIVVLCSSALVPVASVMAAAMLLFRFKG
ncbi:hypothetical protein COCMIDRAFT_107865 [Bipolaris oryzae ATCC 44560]|uniref:Uncharacterized protein n=1 Tax=Bipolaris oryzae ATCC 44560 TaxID=930090 RepID=W6YZ24_COCMI|nr:uncharacterized protein COCMIDRAFT_107865 [Bipolaris oryzae ATCC 44560]EUC40789.1 hypothetical protein COCMIDRAFT_107865 [Bipolaris oryzae ATCC 44560]